MDALLFEELRACPPTADAFARLLATCVRGSAADADFARYLLQCMTQLWVPPGVAALRELARVLPGEMGEAGRELLRAREPFEAEGVQWPRTISAVVDRWQQQQQTAGGGGAALREAAPTDRPSGSAALAASVALGRSDIAGGSGVHIKARTVSASGRPLKRELRRREYWNARMLEQQLRQAPAGAGQGGRGLITPVKSTNDASPAAPASRSDKA